MSSVELSSVELASPLLHHFLEHSAERNADHPCLIELTSQSSYGEVDTHANQMAHMLLQCGLNKGDRVAVLAHNTAFYVECYFAVLKAGGIVVGVTTGADAKTLAFTLSDSGASYLFVGKGMGRAVNGFLNTRPNPELTLLSEGPLRLKEQPLGVRIIDVHQARPDHSKSKPKLSIAQDDIASIIYTSGSTGRPRGAVLSHLNLVSNTQAILEYLKLSPDDRVLAILPFYYIYGLSVLNTHIAASATVVIENRFTYPQAALDTMEKQECTGLSGVPSTYSILLNRSNFASRSFPKLRYITQAGGAMSPAVTKKLMEILPDKSIFIMYGATEAAGRLTYVPPENLGKALGTIGKAIQGVTIRILQQDGSEAKPGEVGQLVATGPNIMQGYWNDPEETQLVLGEYGYYTGDLGYFDENGNLKIVGRQKEMIKSGGHRIAPLEVEEAMLEHEKVHEAAVVGLADEILGEKIIAYVVLANGQADVNDLRSFLRTRLPAYKQPAEIRVTDGLPKNASGKIDKKKL